MNEKMGVTYVRHSADMAVEDSTHVHDARLTRPGKELATKKGKKLIRRYGLPKIVFCSPFRRTKETLEAMLKDVSRTERNKIQIIFDPDLSRYFTREEKRHASVDDETNEAKIPIYETLLEFGQRVQRVVKNMEKYLSSPENIWVVTHTTVYKRLSRAYNVTLPDYIPFNHMFSLGNLRRIEKISEAEKKSFCPDCGKYHK